MYMYLKIYEERSKCHVLRVKLEMVIDIKIILVVFSLVLK